MKTLTVEELCKSIIDCPHSTPIWKDSGIRVIRNFNIKKGQLDFSDGYFVDEGTYSERTKRALPESDDLVISREAPMGEVCIIPKNLKCCLGQRLVLLKVNKEKCFPKYLLYMMQSKYVQEQIGIINKTGSIVSNLNIPDLKALKIPYRPIESQQKIAAVLSALDDKIALNRRMNAKLEQMAKRLYDHWFVQFDFPVSCHSELVSESHSEEMLNQVQHDECTKPYKSSGGKMEYNEVLKRGIPAGWEVKKLSDFAKYVDNTDSADMIVNYISTDNMLPNKAGISDSISKPLKGNFVRYEKFDVLISNIRPYFKKIWFSNLLGNCSTDVLCIRSNSESDSFFIYRTLWKDEFFDYVMQGAKGSKMPRGDKTRIMNYSFAYPSDNTDVLKKFNSFFEPLQKSIWKNESEIQKLTALRDRLLPLLMNGQVEVK